MKTAWAILLISALTDSVIAGGAAFSAGIGETGGYPGKATVIAAGAAAALAAARTIQQALKALKLKVNLVGDPVESWDHAG